MQAIIEAGGMLGRKIKRDENKIWKEGLIYRDKEVIARVGLIFETEDGKLIVVEVKSVTDFRNILVQYDRAKSL